LNKEARANGEVGPGEDKYEARESMSRILKNLAVIADRPLSPEEAIVERNARVVCALLVRGLNGKVKTADFWKIACVRRPALEEPSEVVCLVESPRGC
jgi:hypothetical protein